MPKVKHRHSKMRGRKRRTHYKISAAPTSFRCSQCGKAKKPHSVCPHCGYYGKLQVKRIETAEERKAKRDEKKKKGK